MRQESTIRDGGPGCAGSAEKRLRLRSEEGLSPSGRWPTPDPTNVGCDANLVEVSAFAPNRGSPLRP